MKKVLIIYPHFPPSNLAGVHRARLFAQHLPAFNWAPIILTVHEDFYEEARDNNLVNLLPAELRIEKVKAFKIGKRRLIGDLGLRAFFQLYQKAKEIIKQEKIDFIYIPVPSFYCALLGRLLYTKTGIPYGIDYIDPWVHHFPGSDKVFSRHWLSTQVAKLLEPIAVNKAALITGVAAGYYLPVLERNKKLQRHVVHGAMPYGGEAMDHFAVKNMSVGKMLFKKKEKIQLIYAGAMLPKAYQPLEIIFKAIQDNRGQFGDVEFHFIGTGKMQQGVVAYAIKTLAERYNLWGSIIFEYPERLAYLEVLRYLELSDGAFILGSTEPHYTPSKTYQAVLSGKPIFAVLHIASTAVDVIRCSNAGIVLDFDGKTGLHEIAETFNVSFKIFRQFIQSFSAGSVDQEIFETYSAKSITRKLAGLLDEALEKNSPLKN